VTTLVNSGSFYEGTKIAKPDEFDFFVQLDSFSGPEDIEVEELLYLAQLLQLSQPNQP